MYKNKHQTPRNQPKSTKTKKQLGHKEKQNIAKEIQQNKKRQHASRMAETKRTKKHLSGKQKASAMTTEEYTSTHTTNSESPLNTHRRNFFQKETKAEREIIPEETWKMQEETAQEHIDPKINNKRQNSRLDTYFATKTGKEHQDALNEKIWEGEVRNVIGRLNRNKAVGTAHITAEILRRNKTGLRHQSLTF